MTTIDTARHTTHRWPSFLGDGKRFVYLAAKHRDVTRDTGDVYLGSVDGGDAKLLLSGTSNAVAAGDWILFVRERTLYAQKLGSGGTLEGQPARIADGTLYDGGIFRAAISVSDTGRLIYYTGSVNDYASKESGRQEVYVLARDNISRKWQVSSAGGSTPSWRPDGKELFLVDATGPLVAVPVDVRGTELALGAPTALFTPPIGWQWYEPVQSAEAQFLMVVPEMQVNRPRLTLMTDWMRLLAR